MENRNEGEGRCWEVRAYLKKEDRDGNGKRRSNPGSKEKGKRKQFTSIVEKDIGRDQTSSIRGREKGSIWEKERNSRSSP